MAFTAFSTGNQKSIKKLTLIEQRELGIKGNLQADDIERFKKLERITENIISPFCTRLNRGVKHGLIKVYRD